MKRNPWFKKKGWIYVPIKIPGFVILFIFLAFCIHIMFKVNDGSHSVSDLFYGAFPYVVPAFILYLWIGTQTQERD